MTICIFNCHRLLSSCFETMPHPWHCGRTPPPAPSGWWEWSCAGSACHGFGASDRMTRKPLRCPSGGCRCSQSVSPAGLRASLWRWQRWTGDVFSGSCRRNPTNWPIGPAFLEITLSRRINANFSWSLGKGNMLQPTGGRFLILYDIIKPSPAIVVSKYRLKTPTNWENHSNLPKAFGMFQKEIHSPFVANRMHPKSWPCNIRFSRHWGLDSYSMMSYN